MRSQHVCLPYLEQPNDFLQRPNGDDFYDFNGGGSLTARGYKADLSCMNILVDLTEEDAETISGGKERFIIRNETNLRIPYAIDGTQINRPHGGSESVWTAEKGGTIAFDYDFGLAGVQSRKYNLADGRTYAFRLDTRTPYGGDIELFDVT